ncbi:hypothetical protein BC628DRAFT_1418958 [Trametes gibbosa]|nr:hypothetical protein BC628DRAFT_1418958 [Trametes gibbosa]
MFSTKLTTVLAALAVAATAVSAAPATFNGGKVDVVFRPHVTAPTADAVWPAGSVQTITWDTSDIPDDVKNQTGLILLGYIQGDDSNEHLDVAHPLATGFPISAGIANVTVPEVPTRKDYVVVLFGDSGNTSPKFTITSAQASSLPAPSGASAPAIPSASSIFSLFA